MTLEYTIWRQRWFWWGGLLVLGWLGEGRAGLPFLALFAGVALLAQGLLWLSTRFPRTRTWKRRVGVVIDAVFWLAFLMRSPDWLVPAYVLLALGPTFITWRTLGKESAIGFLGFLALVSTGIRLLSGERSLAAMLPALLPWGIALAFVLLEGHLQETARRFQGHMEERDLEAALQALSDLTIRLLNSADYERILADSLEACAHILCPRNLNHVQGVGFTFSPTNPEEVVVTATFQGDPAWRERRVPLTGLLRDVLMTGESRITRPDATLVEVFPSLRNRWLFFFPLYAKLDLYGMLMLTFPRRPTPTPTQQTLLESLVRITSQTLQVHRLLYELERDRREILLSEEDTRHRLARDLHDGPIQRVSAISMQIDFIRTLLQNQPERVPAELDAMQETIQQAVQELRTFMFTLRPIVLETEGLVAALEQFAKRLRTHERLNIRVEAGDIPRLDPVVEQNIFAIVQEAVNNARKHAGGAPITIRLHTARDGLEVEVRDEGPGFDLERVRQGYGERTSLGLINMEERAEMIGAILTIETAPNAGTTVKLFVPMQTF